MAIALKEQVIPQLLKFFPVLISDWDDWALLGGTRQHILSNSALMLGEIKDAILIENSTAAILIDDTL